MNGNALVGATVLVQNYSNSANAAIYSDNGLTPISTSTVVTGSDGQFSFFAADGDYNLVMSKNSTVFKTQSPVTLFDGAAQLTFADTGTANAYAISNSALEKALRTGLRSSVQIANSNTGASTYSYNGLAAKPIILPGGATLGPGALLANGIYTLEYDGTSWQLRNAIVSYARTQAEITAGVTPTNLSYPPLNVFRYGAKGDGATNDIAAFNSAVAVASVAGGTVYVPGGFTFNVNTNINVTASNVRIAGDGPSSIIQFTDTTHRYNGITFTGTSGSYISNPVVENLQLIGAGYTFGVIQSGSAVLGTYVINFRVDNVVMHEWSDNGLATGNSAAANGVQFTNNVIYNVNQGISTFNTSSNIIVTGNQIYNVRYYVGIQIEGSGGTDDYCVCSNNIVHTCDGVASGGQADGIEIQLCPYSVVVGNIVYGVTGVTSSGNGNGIFLYGSPYSTVTGNMSYSNTGYGIVIESNSGNCAVCGNVTANNVLGSCLLSDGGAAASYNVVIDASNNFTEGTITQVGNVSLVNAFGNIVRNKNSFTPTVVGTTTAGVTSGGTTAAEYTVLDNVVNFTMTISYTSTTGTGNIQINGLPLVSSASNLSAVSVRVNGLPITSGNQLQAFINQSSSSIALNQWTPSTGALAAVPLPSSLAGLTISGSYFTS